MVGENMVNRPSDRIKALLTCIIAPGFYIEYLIFAYSPDLMPPFYYITRSCVIFDALAFFITYAVGAFSMYKAMKYLKFGGIYFRVFASVAFSTFVTYYFLKIFPVVLLPYILTFGRYLHL